MFRVTRLIMTIVEDGPWSVFCSSTVVKLLLLICVAFDPWSYCCCCCCCCCCLLLSIKACPMPSPSLTGALIRQSCASLTNLPPSLSRAERNTSLNWFKCFFFCIKEFFPDTYLNIAQHLQYSFVHLFLPHKKLLRSLKTKFQIVYLFVVKTKSTLF